MKSRIYPRSIWPNVRSEFQGVETFSKKNGIEERGEKKERKKEEGGRGLKKEERWWQSTAKKIQGESLVDDLIWSRQNVGNWNATGRKKKRAKIWLALEKFRWPVSSQYRVASSKRKGWVSGGCERRVLNLPPRGKYRRTSDLSLYREMLYTTRYRHLVWRGWTFLLKKKKERKHRCLKLGNSNNRVFRGRFIFLGDF